jgi:hypothetical protein
LLVGGINDGLGVLLGDVPFHDFQDGLVDFQLHGEPPKNSFWSLVFIALEDQTASKKHHSPNQRNFLL